MIAWVAGLALASPGPDPVAVAEAVVADPSARLVGVLPRGGPAGPSGYGPDGALVVMRPVLDGVLVEGTIRVRLGPDGEVRSVRRPSTPDRVVRGAPIPVEHALSAARARAPLAAPTARLRWVVLGGALRQVWIVEGAGPAAGRAVPRVWVDAVSGGIVREDDAATDATTGLAPQARVYPNNPVLDAAPTLVELPLAAAALSDEQLEVRQCRDLGEVVTAETSKGTVSYRVCTSSAPAGPIDGDWLFDPVPYPADPASDEDDFVAPHVYWNVHEGLDWLALRGWTPLPDFDPRLVVTTNYRTTDWSTTDSATLPTSPLDPYDNAYFSGGYEDYNGDWQAPVLVFGQGSASDFGYDADVIHHELGHFVVRSMSGPWYSEDSEYGPSVDASALNEGLADYFSAALHGRARLAEYAVGEYDPELVRDLSGFATCSADLYGEPHWDSLPFSQGLWAARTAAADPVAFDRIVLDSLAGIGVSPTKADAVRVILAEAATQLAQDTVDALSEAWDARGMLDCEPIIDVTPSDTPFRPYGIVPGAWRYTTAGEEPGLLQYRVEVPEDGALTLRFLQYEDTGVYPWDEPPEPLGVVGRAGEHILWEQEDASFTTTFTGYYVQFTVVDWTTNADRVADAVEVASYPYEDDPRYVVHEYEASWPVAAGPFVFQLVNDHEAEAIARDLTLGFAPTPPPDTTPSTPTPTTPETEPGSPAEGEAKGGCGCGSTGGSGALAALVAAVAAARRRRVVQPPRR